MEDSTRTDDRPTRSCFGHNGGEGSRRDRDPTGRTKFHVSGSVSQGPFWESPAEVRSPVRRHPVHPAEAEDGFTPGIVTFRRGETGPDEP